MNAQKKSAYQNFLFFLLFFLPYLAVTLFLFHRQSVHYGGNYISDMEPYIAEIQHIDSGYDYPYPLLFLTGRFFLLFTSPEHAIAIAATLLNGLTAIALKFFLDQQMQTSTQSPFKRNILSTCLTFSLLLSSMLFPLSYLGRYQEVQDGFLYRYLGVFTPNPYHNATYLAARPFSTAAFFLFADILPRYETENKWYSRRYLLFSAFLLLSTLAKPSFSLILTATAGCIMLFRLIKSRFQNSKAFLHLGIYFIPTFLALLYQYKDVFTSSGGEETGVGFGFLTAWSAVLDTAGLNLPEAILLGMAFPFSVLFFQLFRKKKLSDTGHGRKLPGILTFSWQFYLLSLITLMFFYEKGFRMAHLNFAWGYMYGLFFSYTASLIVLCKNTLRRTQPLWQLLVQWGLYGLHLLCGLDYFRVLLQGGLFH